MRGVLAAVWLAVIPIAADAADIDVRVVDANGAPAAGAVVFIESDRLSAAVKPMQGVQVAQKDKTFIPELTIITRDTAVEFPNNDTVRHHVYSFSPAKPFELKLYIGKPKAPVRFDTAGVVELGCNIHDQMHGWVLIADTPVYGAVDASGHFSARDLTPDTYRIRVWHRSLPFGAPPPVRTLTLQAQASETLVFELEDLRQ